MPNSTFIISDKNVVFSNVIGIYQDIKVFIDQHDHVNIDFAAVEHNDSSALALIIKLIRTANSLQKKLSFSNISPKLHSAAVAYGIDEILQNASRN